jgi:hypothetical protein
MARRASRINVNWETNDGVKGAFTWDQVTVEVLMDIRSELQKLNSLLHCPNFTAIPRKLDRISRNTAKPRKAKRPKRPKLRAVA